MDRPSPRTVAPLLASPPIRRWLLLLLIWWPSVLAAENEAPAYAFYYGPHPPAHLLAHFDYVVLEPDHLSSTERKVLARDSRLLAYVSVGEVGPERAWRKDLDSEWILGRNPAWNSSVMDLAHPGWRAYLLEHRFRPLWQAGYRGFFLDTLDSHHLITDPQTPERRRQEAGLTALVKALRDRFPDAHLVVNRGFEVIDRIGPLVDGLAAESLYQGWDPVTRTHVTVSNADRSWLRTKLDETAERFPHLHLLVLDYLPDTAVDEARALARRIHADGFIPWISNVEQDRVGIGMMEVLPREVLMLWDSRQETEGELAFADIHRMAAMPLEYLGYVPVYHDLAEGLPEPVSRDRWAGVVSWFHQTVDTPDYALWVQSTFEAGVPMLIMGDPGFETTALRFDLLGLEPAGNAGIGPWAVTRRSDLVGFEAEPPRNTATSIEGFFTEGDTVQVHLAVRGADGLERAVVVTARWGGIALTPWVVDQSIDDHIRWIVDPFSLLRRALKLPMLPQPDVTTLNGRRLWMNHIDGDAFISKAELPGAPWAAEVIRDRVLTHWKVPHTVSIIEGEIGPDGLKPESAPEFEAIARSIFELSNVEPASHSYSHPFVWSKLQEGDAPNGYNLPIPGYRFDLEREILGSIRYIESRLLPPEKRCRIFQWTGDTLPGEAALALTELHGIYNINGGDTHITRLRPFLAFVSAMARVVNGHVQVYAPVMNENIYTNEWTGPYWGFRRVIETFELTDKPRRLKPIDIYYHFYSGTKPAALKALEQIYRWAQTQETTPVFLSEYIPLVLEFRRISVARRLDGRLQYRGLDRLRQLRLFEGGIDLDASQGVAGHRRLHDGLYIHLADDAPLIAVTRNGRPPNGPYLYQANGHLSKWTRQGRAVQIELESHAPALLEVAGVKRHCILKLEKGERLKRKARTGHVRFVFHNRKKIHGFLQCE